MSDDAPRSPSAVQAVTVFLSSASKVDRVYFDAAAAMGRAIAGQNWTLVYGGNAVGCMGALADGVRQAGGRVVGITPRFFVDQNLSDEAADELIIVETMRERKQLLEARADAFVALPGGLGTFEELFEIIVGRQLGQHRKPIVIFNANGYYTPLLELFQRGIAEHFVRANTMDQIYVGSTVDEVIQRLRSPV